MSLTEHERETIVNMNDGGELAQVYTARRRMITRLKNNPAAVLVADLPAGVWINQPRPTIQSQETVGINQAA